VPVNLPPEVINQLLNQHFVQHGQVPNLLATIQQHQQTVALRQNIANLQGQLQQYQQRREEATDPDELQRLDNQIAHLQEQIPTLEQQLSSQPQPRTRRENPEPQAERQSSNESLNSGREQPSSGDAAPAERTSPAPSAPPAISPPHDASPNITEAPPSLSNSTTPPVAAGPNQPVSVSRSGVMPDGSRWAMNMTTVVNDGNPQQLAGVPAFAHPHLPHQQPGVPVFAQPQFPHQMPFPFMQQPGAVPGRMGTPPAGLRPMGTPRSVSPARSVSEGQRRSGTPAAELQTRLEHTRREIENVNRLLGVMQTGNMATGEPAPPLTEEARRQLQTYSASMVRHIDGFGADLNSLANALHPNVRTQPDFVSLQVLYRSVHAQGRAIQQQVQNLGSTSSPTSAPAQTQTDGSADITTNSLARGPEAFLRPDQAPLTSQRSTSQPSTGADVARVPSPQVPQANTLNQNALPVPNNVPASAPSPQLHLLTDPSGTPHALVVGPTGHFTTSILPPEIMYGLLAAQLPHDQLVAEFSRIMREALFPHTTLGYFGPTAGLPQPPGANNASSWAAFTARQERRQARAAQQAGVAQPLQNAIQRAAQLNGAQPQAQAAAPAAPVVNGEARDLLGPIMRNLWIAVRIIMFAYFFLASGRGYGRLLILAGAALIVYALNLGFMGEQMNGLWEGFRAHFEALIGLPAARPQPAAGEQAQPNGEGAAPVAPSPEETARRLVEQQQAQNRNWIRERARQVERTIALFVASLWPGVGEGLVQAQERAENERRIAEETRAREEEEARKSKEDAEKEKNEMEKTSEAGPSSVPVNYLAGAATAATGADVDGAEGMSRVNKGKGKERASEEEVESQESLRADSEQPNLGVD
jgi:hypothetical protein